MYIVLWLKLPLLITILILAVIIVILKERGGINWKISYYNYYIREPTKQREMKKNFEKRLKELKRSHKELIKRKNRKKESSNGIYDRFEYPVLTAEHTPLFWRYDLNKETNPFLMERFGINAVLNSGAIKWNNKYLLMARVEGVDRKSFFAVAESPNGIDNFKFWDYPVTIPETENPIQMYMICVGAA